MKIISEKIQNWLRFSHPAIFAIYAMISSFTVYSCMYALRKPFAVAIFDGISFFGVDYKILLITAQVVGYALSKFLGIKIISEIKPSDRIKYFVVLFLISIISLLFFPIVSVPWNIIFLFTNGLPLGLIWGLVFSFLEGRRSTELLAAGLSVSFIFSSGLVKSVGAFLLYNLNVSEFWMPFFTGLIFLPLLIISTWMLFQVPPPSKEDIEKRTKREPMDAKARKELFKKFSFGLVLLIILYVLLTTFRDLRDNFAAEIWNSLGMKVNSEIFFLTEVPISLILLITTGMIIFIKNNYYAFVVSNLIILAGIVLIGLGSFLFSQRFISGSIWMIILGTGLYMGYVPFNNILFERLIATFKCFGNVGFLIYLADSFGYLGSVLIMLVKNFFNPMASWLVFVVDTSYILTFIGFIVIIISIIYFTNKHKQERIKNQVEYI